LNGEKGKNINFIKIVLQQFRKIFLFYKIITKDKESIGKDCSLNWQ
jgi:hypothetical protein